MPKQFVKSWNSPQVLKSKVPNKHFSIFASKFQEKVFFVCKWTYYLPDQEKILYRICVPTFKEIWACFVFYIIYSIFTVESKISSKLVKALCNTHKIRYHLFSWHETHLERITSPFCPVEPKYRIAFYVCFGEPSKVPSFF